jgi:hypothetical protein
VAVSTQHAFLGLPDHILHQGKKVPQLADLRFYPGTSPADGFPPSAQPVCEQKV